MKKSVLALIRWKNNNKLESVDIQVGFPFDLDNEEYFWYCFDDNDLEYLQDKDNHEVFYIERILSSIDI